MQYQEKLNETMKTLKEHLPKGTESKEKLARLILLFEEKEPTLGDIESAFWLSGDLSESEGHDRDFDEAIRTQYFDMKERKQYADDCAEFSSDPSVLGLVPVCAALSVRPFVHLKDLEKSLSGRYDDPRRAINYAIGRGLADIRWFGTSGRSGVVSETSKGESLLRYAPSVVVKILVERK